MSSLLSKETLAVKRQTNFGQYDDDGFAEIPVFQNLTTLGRAVPLSGFEILQVPEADRTRQVLNWFTLERLEHKDLIVRGGEDFEVQTVEDWSESGECISFFKCRLVKVDVER